MNYITADLKELWFLLICGFFPLSLHLLSLIGISDSLGFFIVSPPVLRDRYCIYVQSSLSVTDKCNVCRCAGPSLNYRNRMASCPLTSHLFSWHLLKSIIFTISPFLSSHCGIDQEITNFVRIQRSEKDHIVSIPLGKNLWEGSLKSYIRQYSLKYCS